MVDNDEYRSTSGENFSLAQAMRPYTRNKMLFILIMLLALGLGAVYLYWKIPLYRIQASLVIKDEKKGESISLTLKELDFLDEQKIVDNEAEIVRSENTIKKVVNSLNLNIAYFEKIDFLRKRPLFDDSPVELRVIRPGLSLYEDPIDVILAEGDQFEIKSRRGKYRFGDTIHFDEDSAAISLTRRMNKASTNKVRIVISDPDKSTQLLRGKVSATAASKNSSVLYLSMLYPSREKGTQILTEIIKEYDRANIAEKRGQRDSIVALIEERLLGIGQQVKKLEGKEQDLKTQQGVTFLSDDARSYLEQAKENDKEYAEAELQLDNIQKVAGYLDGNSGMTSPPNINLKDPVLTNMVTTLNQLELEQESLRKKSGPQHPSVLAVTKQVDDLKRSLDENIKLQRGSLEKKIEILKKSQERVNSGISRIPSSERNLLGIMREKTIRENIYSFLLEKREEASLSDASVFSKMRWLDQPYSSIKTVKPNKIMVFASAVLAGMLLFIGIVTLKEGSRSRIRSETLKSKLPYPVLGYIPHMKAFSYLSFTNKQSIITEQFRWMRTTLEKPKGVSGPESQVILVTSPSVKDGKSFVSLNLAASFAKVHKTVLVDFDLRKSRMAALFNLPFSNELSLQLESGRLNLESLVRRIDDKLELYLIANDSVLEDTTSLLDQANLDELFRMLRDQFDVIIINTPPITYFTDAYKLERFSDSNIIVIRDRHDTLKQVERIHQIIRAKSIKPPTIVYNSIPLSELFEKRQLRAYQSYEYS